MELSLFIWSDHFPSYYLLHLPNFYYKDFSTPTRVFFQKSFSLFDLSKFMSTLFSPFFFFFLLMCGRYCFKSWQDLKLKTKKEHYFNLYVPNFRIFFFTQSAKLKNSLFFFFWLELPLYLFNFELVSLPH